MTISRKGLDRAIARIIYKLETIREEGYDPAPEVRAGTRWTG